MNGGCEWTDEHTAWDCDMFGDFAAELAAKKAAAAEGHAAPEREPAAKPKAPTKRQPNARRPEPVTASQSPQPATVNDFYAYLPAHAYIYIHTRETWPVSAVNGALPYPIGVSGKALKPSAWLDRHRAVQQMTWSPGEPEIIADRVLQVSGWIALAGARVFNLYRAPDAAAGNPAKAGPWLDHLRLIYPDEADQLLRWFAHRAQKPGDKCNHAIVLGGMQGIGKDTILEPLKYAVGPWNWSDINPTQMLGRFCGWAKSVIVRVNEARDLGDVDRFSFYDHSKTYIAAPPDVLRVDEKNLREHYVQNVLGLIITTNHECDGLYLPADDRRHFVAWSQHTRDSFSADYWTKLYRWYADGGIGHVAAFLRAFDLTGFDPKAPPPKTPAFWRIVAAGESPESSELRDVLDAMGNPRAVVVEDLIRAAEQMGNAALGIELGERRNRRSLPRRLGRVDYVPVRNPDAADGLFKVGGRRQAVYALRTMSPAEQTSAARKLPLPWVPLRCSQ